MIALAESGHHLREASGGALQNLGVPLAGAVATGGTPAASGNHYGDRPPRETSSVVPGIAAR